MTDPNLQKSSVFCGYLRSVAQHCDPPYRAIGYSYTYRIYVFQGIAGSHAISSPKRGYRTMMLMFSRLIGRGGIAGQGCSLRYRAPQGGIAAILSQIAVSWATKYLRFPAPSTCLNFQEKSAWPCLQNLVVKKKSL